MKFGRKLMLLAACLPGGTEPELEETAVAYHFFENKISCPGPYWDVAVLSPE